MLTNGFRATGGDRRDARTPWSDGVSEGDLNLQYSRCLAHRVGLVNQLSPGGSDSDEQRVDHMEKPHRSDVFWQMTGRSRTEQRLYRPCPTGAIEVPARQPR